MNNTLLMTVGRTLLGLYFLIPGIMKFAAWDQHIDMMAHHGVPAAAPLLLIATLTEIIAGLLLIANRFVRFNAIWLAVLVIVINVMMHGFWKFEGIEAAHEMQNFIKNLGIFAGLLVLASVSPKRKLTPKTLGTSDRNLSS